jgi:hypothetical protein
MEGQMETIQHYYSNKAQRSADESSGLGKVLVAAALMILVLAFSGCAGTLDKTASICLGEGRDFEYTRAEGFEKASCSGGRTSQTTVKVSR